MRSATSAGSPSAERQRKLEDGHGILRIQENISFLDRPQSEGIPSDADRRVQEGHQDPETSKLPIDKLLGKSPLLLPDSSSCYSFQVLPQADIALRKVESLDSPQIYIAERRIPD